MKYVKIRNTYKDLANGGYEKLTKKEFDDGDVREIVEEFDSNDNITKDKKGVLYENEYHENGKLKSKSNKNEIKKYDEKGRIIETVINKLGTGLKRNYTEDNGVIICDETLHDEPLSKAYTRYINKKDNEYFRLQVNVNGTDGSKSEDNIYLRYNSKIKDNHVKTLTRQDTDKIIEKEIDEKGNCIMHRVYVVDEEGFSQYDDHNNVIRQEYNDIDNVITQAATRELEYDDKNRIIQDISKVYDTNEIDDYMKDKEFNLKDLYYQLNK